MSRTTLLQKIRMRNKMRIYIVPTWYCLLFSICLIAYASYGISSRNVIPITGTIVLFMIEMLAMVETNMNVRDVAVLSFRCVPTPENQEGMASAEMTAIDSVWAVGLSAKVKNGRSLKPSLVSLDPKKTKSTLATVRLPPKPRGIHDLPALQIGSRFPLGMFHAWRNITFPGTQVVYPQPKGESLETLTLAQARAEKNGPAETTHAQQLDQEYKQHKEFSPGESVRRIDWRASSRRAKIISKEFAGQPGTASLIFRWSDTTQMQPEDKLRQLSLWIQEAKARNLSYGLETPQRIIPCAQGEGQWRRCVTHLAEFDLTAQQSGSAA